MPVDPSSTARIRQLNDDFRRSLQGGHIVLTQCVRALAPGRLARILRRLRAYDDFEAGDDPHGEHDFGTIDDVGDRFFWKIDYHDPSLLAGSEDPANPLVTTRVLTLMRTDEY